MSSYSDDAETLSPRMVSVLRSAARGSSSSETAGELHVSPATVKAIRAAALRRLHARNVVEAVALGIKRGEL